MIRLLLLALSLTLPLSAHALGKRPTPVTSEQRASLITRRDEIREWRTLCPNGEFSSDASGCNQGDLTLFAGISCLAGEKQFCDNVARAQGTNGRWWRAPSAIENDPIDSFSRDQSLGVLAYLIASHDLERAKRWLDWIHSNQGQLCTRVSDNRCMMLPGTWSTFARVWNHLGLDLEGPMETWWGLTELILYIDAMTVEVDFPLHLEAVSLWLLRETGNDNWLLNFIADQIYYRDPGNLFYRYLHEGATSALADEILQKCPKTRPEHREDWSWQRPAQSEPWLKSNGHDCVFLINLVVRDRVNPLAR